MSIDTASANIESSAGQIAENQAQEEAFNPDAPSQIGIPLVQRRLCVRPVSHTDLPDLVALDQRCLGGIWSIDGYSREIDSPNSDLIVLSSPLAPHASFLGLACLWSILEEAHITLLGVDPAYRRQGLGQLLLYVLLTCAQQRGLERATLEVRVSNQRAIALYEQFGFRRAGCRKHYYPDDEDALILWLNGLHHPEFNRSRHQWWQRIQTKLQAAGWLVKTDDSLPLTLEA